MQSFLLKKKTKENFVEGIKVLEFSTQENYISSLKKFEKFCAFKYQNRSTNEILDELKSLPKDNIDEAFFGVLQDFVNWMTTLDLSNTTINQYYQIVVYYFNYHGIRTHPVDLRQNVKLPKKIREKLHPLNKDEIRELFKHTPDHRQLLYLILLGTRMRIRECVVLRKSDFDTENFKRIKIEIPAKFTKTKTAHTTFVTKEAEIRLKLRLKSLNDDDLVFATNSLPYHAAMTEIEAFARYRKRAGLTQRYESTKRHHISLHSFRSFFFSNARRIHDTDIAHSMVGHTTYLDMYDRKEDSEKLELFCKVEPKLRLFS